MFYSLPCFEYYRPGSLEELLELIDRLSDYRIIAGGSDLLNDMRIGRYRPRAVVDINGVRELDYIVNEGSVVRIGALARLQRLLESSVIREKTPLLYEAVYNMASWQIRCRATIGGNLCNASPAADTAPPLLAYDAELVLASVNGERVVKAREFFRGPRETVLERNEVLKEVRVPVYSGWGWCFSKFGRRNSFTLSIVSVAVLLSVEDNVFKDIRVALGSVAPRPVRAASVEEALRGRNVSVDVIEEASRLVVNDISPISDVRASEWYRRKLSIVLVRDSIVKALERIGYRVSGG